MTREVEWDDAQREALLGLGLYHRGICGTCGFHRSLTSDRTNHFAIEEVSCNVCKGSAVSGRIQHAADEKKVKAMGENPPPHAPRPGDGRTMTVRLLSPLEVEARRAERAG